MRTSEQKVTGKTVAKASVKTILVLVLVIGILILDVLAIRGVYFGIRYVGDRIGDFGEYLAQIGDSFEKEEAETERRPMTEEEKRRILEEEERKLQEIFEADYPPKKISEDK